MKTVESQDGDGSGHSNVEMMRRRMVVVVLLLMMMMIVVVVAMDALCCKTYYTFEEKKTQQKSNYTNTSMISGKKNSVKFYSQRVSFSTYRTSICLCIRAGARCLCHNSYCHCTTIFGISHFLIVLK